MSPIGQFAAGLRPKNENSSFTVGVASVHVSRDQRELQRRSTSADKRQEAPTRKMPIAPSASRRAVAGYIATVFALLLHMLRSARFAGWRRVRSAALALAVLAAAGCDGCHTQTSPGPLRPDENTRFYVSDRLGSTALVLDQSGTVIARDAASPFGDPWIAWRQETKHPTYRYTGNEDVPVARSVTIGVREYLPELGRWVSPDPLYLGNAEARLERPGERNLYRYSANDPINNVDPTGTSVWTKLAKVGGKLAKGASAVEAFAGTVEDVGTLVSPDSSAGARVLAGLSLASEVLPVSGRDIFEAGSWGLKAIGAAPVRKALPSPRTSLPDQYWIKKKTPSQTTPSVTVAQTSPGRGHVVGNNIHVTNPAKPSSRGGTYETTAHYDPYGRLIGRTDETTHNMPRAHANPHHHRYDPATGASINRPGPHPKGTAKGVWPGRHPSHPTHSE
ncbi:MAG: RHS repeat-associated core domain-containing protein [Myxococcales bacterium]|nr:RHS repeat-associated core domain-containing protein [Myxococcales bacterium]